MTHPHIPFDEGAIEDIAARLDLRAPNKAAVTKVAELLDAANGQPVEAVLDLATGVGKTYIAAALIDYLADAGVRHFIIITPGKTIQSKTIANFTPGHPKSVLAGMECEPVVVTAEDFATGSVRAAIDDPEVVKVFVFNIQQLIRPKAKSSRKARKFQEWLGRGLYDHLRSLDDLVVLSDEHHVYQDNAKAFSAAVHDLDAMATIGLTATPAKGQLDDVVFTYPLAAAIADRLVKTPVIVGRKDDRSDVETRLRDGLTLLDAKRRAIEAWCNTTGEERVNPVMFVVADNIDNADAVTETLQRLLDNYDDAVLTIHSDSTEDSLARLDAVESPDSPVRVIVAVSMLKEGWDVRNIYVICSLRPSIKDSLTEQTLGRGLRLPWGRYTGEELLDTVEVLSHERYERLLERANVLLEGLVPDRTKVKPPTQPASGGQPPEVTVDVTDGTEANDPETQSDTDAEARDADTEAETETDGGEASGTEPGATGGPTVTVTDIDDRTAVAAAEADALELVVEPAVGRNIQLPQITRTPHAVHFNLSKVPNQDFEDLGRSLAAVPGDTLRRQRLDVEFSGDRLVLKSTEAADAISAAVPNLPLATVEQRLTEALLELNIVEATTPNVKAAKRLTEALVKGAGGEAASEHLSWFLNTAVQGAVAIVRKHYAQEPVSFDDSVEMVAFHPVRPGRVVDPNRTGQFSKKVGYTNWSKSVMSIEWFDSKPERTLANLVDAADEVEVWARLQRNDLALRFQGGVYNPDFYVQLKDGTHWLLEVKADRHMDDDDVVAKREAAEYLSRLITDEGGAGTWHYLLVSETAVNNARGNWSVLLAQAGFSD